LNIIGKFHGIHTKVLSDFSSYNRCVRVPWKIQNEIFYDVVDGTTWTRRDDAFP